MGISWGSAQSPNCQALTVAELGQVNWNNVDLSEWVSMLNIANVGPASVQLTADGLTGAGSILSQTLGKPQPNAITRAINNSSAITAAPPH